MQAICPRCGQPTEDGLCPQCLQETTELVSCPNQVDVVICSACGSQQINGKWQLPGTLPLQDLAAQAAVDAVWIHKEMIQPEIDVDLKVAGATRYLAEIEITPSGLGLHWPRLDADVYVPGFMKGIYGTRRWMAALLGAEGGKSSSPAKAAAARTNGAKGGRPRKQA